VATEVNIGAPQGRHRVLRRAIANQRTRGAQQATDESQEPLGESPVRFECGSATLP